MVLFLQITNIFSFFDASWQGQYHTLGKVCWCSINISYCWGQKEEIPTAVDSLFVLFWGCLGKVWIYHQVKKTRVIFSPTKCGSLQLATLSNRTQHSASVVLEAIDEPRHETIMHSVKSADATSTFNSAWARFLMGSTLRRQLSPTASHPSLHPCQFLLFFSKIWQLCSLSVGEACCFSCQFSS